VSSEILATEKRLTTNSHKLARKVIRHGFYTVISSYLGHRGHRGHREKKGYQESRRLGSGGQEIRKANRGLRPRGPRSGAKYRYTTTRLHIIPCSFTRIL